MKSLFLLGMLLFGNVALANQSVDDLAMILADQDVKNYIGEDQINSVLNNGNRTFTLSFGTCMMQVQVQTACPPNGNDTSACINIVFFDPSQMNCI
jgi:hypothetical protein